MGVAIQVNRYISVKEIKNFIKEVLRKGLEKDEWDVLILITRKGYWAYKLLVKSEMQEALKKAGKKIYSDRYITKCIKYKEELQGKRVWIYDDTMTNGTVPFFYYCQLKKYGIAVVPIVYALSAEYPSSESQKYLEREYQRVVRNLHMTDTEIQNKANQYIQEFNQDLRWHVRLSADHISDVCVNETKLFQKCLAPMVMDLPILSRMKRAGKRLSVPAYMDEGSGYGIKIEQSIFTKFTMLSLKWEFVENEFKYQNLDIQCSYFRMNDDMLKDLSFPFLHDLVVKCKYQVEEGMIRCVFVPFAIFRSMSFKDTVCCFFSLLDENDYGDEVFSVIADGLGMTLQELNECDPKILADDPKLLEMMKKNHNLARYMFRSIIFYVSVLAGDSFCEYVKELIGLELDYDYDIMRENFSEQFVERFKSHHRDEYAYRTALLQLPEFESVLPVNVREEEVTQSQIASGGEIEQKLHIIKRLIQNKNAVDEDIKCRIFTIETLEKELNSMFAIGDEGAQKEFITTTIIEMLDTSRFGNEIYVDNDEMIIYRGFRYGENSELLFLTGMEYFYVFVLAFYRNLNAGGDRQGRSKLYKERYMEFAEHLELHFENEKYFGTLISKSVFLFLKDYFGNIKESKIEEQIMNKMFVLSDYWDKGNYQGIRSFADRAFGLVEYWM